MKRRHIAIVTLLGNGHVYPVLPLSSELVKLGYRVTFPTCNHYSWAVSRIGAEPILYKDTTPSKEAVEHWKAIAPLGVSDPRWFLLNEHAWSYVVQSNTEMLDQLQNFYDENAPDLVLYNKYCFAGRILAKRLNSPTIQISAHFAHYQQFFFRQNGICRNPEGMTDTSERIDSFFSHHGITTENNLWHNEELNIYLIPEKFQHHRDSFDKRFLFAGRSLDRPFLRSWVNGSGGRPVILVSGYSGLSGIKADAVTTFRMFVDALSNSECHCIVSIGENTSAGSLGLLPKNFEINQRASHLEILPHTSLLICHGGMGSTLEAIYNGVPVLAIPSSPTTEEVAYRVVELGLGTSIGKDVLSPEMIRSSVGMMMADFSLRHRVEEMQRIFGGDGGMLMAAEQVDKFLQEA